MIRTSRPRWRMAGATRRRIGSVAIALALLAGAAAVPTGARAGKGDHDRARAALQSGEIRPLSEILDKVRATLPGEVVGVELEREDGAWIYELKVITADGRRREVEVDARTGAIMQDREKGE